MKEVENLLTCLVQRGWKPWGKGVDKIVVCPKEEFTDDRNLFIDVNFSDGFSTYRSFRELVSLESGLWQFVCERGFCRYDENADYRRDKLTIHPLCLDCEEKTLEENWDSDPEYRLLESALIPEEELAKFLVENIKVEG